jgi:hypothetical protein
MRVRTPDFRHRLQSSKSLTKARKRRSMLVDVCTRGGPELVVTTTR